MIGSQSSRVRRRILLSASSLALLAASNAPALAQNDNTSQTPPAAAAPQPPAVTPAPAAPATAPAPQQESATPAPQQTPTPTTPEQGAGGNVLPETRVVAPVERRQPRTRPPQVVANLPPAPTQTEVVAKQNQAFDAARQNILAPAGANSYELGRQAIEAL